MEAQPSKATGVIIGVATVVVVCALLAFGFMQWRSASVDAPASPAAVAAEPPAEIVPVEPAPIVGKQRVVPALLSPSAEVLGRIASAEADALSRHNARLLQLKTITFDGTCIWFGSQKGRKMNVSYDLTQDAGQIICGPNACQINAGLVTVEQDSAMHVDALYGLMFRRFNPTDFAVSAEAKLDRAGTITPAIRMTSTGEKLWFDAATGLLLRLETNIEAGPVAIDFADHAATSAGGDVWFPMKISVEVPIAWFGFNIDNNPPRIGVRIDPKSVAIVPLADPERGL